MIVCSLAFSIGVAWGGVQYGLPLAAKHGAELIPEDVLYPLGDDVLEWLDENLFKPSKLPHNRQLEIEKDFERLFNQERKYHLLFRASPKIGANALALPNNHIILTDELVLLTEQDQQIHAVLAHEVGHIEKKHALRRLLQQAGVAAILMVFAGDVSSVSSAVAYLPVLLLELGYSRSFEFEADAFALDFMDQEGMEAEHLARALTLLSIHHDHEKDQETAVEHESQESENIKFQDYLSTHPAVEDRVKRISDWHSDKTL